MEGFLPDDGTENVSDHGDGVNIVNCPRYKEDR